MRLLVLALSLIGPTSLAFVPPKINVARPASCFASDDDDLLLGLHDDDDKWKLPPLRNNPDISSDEPASRPRRRNQDSSNSSPAAAPRSRRGPSFQVENGIGINTAGWGDSRRGFLKTYNPADLQVYTKTYIWFCGIIRL